MYCVCFEGRSVDSFWIAHHPPPPNLSGLLHCAPPPPHPACTTVVLLSDFTFLWIPSFAGRNTLLDLSTTNCFLAINNALVSGL